MILPWRDPRAGWWAAQMESWRSAWLDEPARALVWRWLIEEQYISLNTLAAWERLEPKVLSQQAAALGIDTFRKPNRLTLLSVQELITRQAQGESVAKMAAELGVSAHSVGHYIRQHKKA